MKDKAEKKVSFRETIRVAWKPYKRLYTYVGPYKWRFILGLALGFLFGVTQGCLPLVLQKVTSTIFHGAAPKATDLDPSFGITQRRRIGEVDRLHLPSDPRGHDRTQPDGIRQRLIT